MSSCQIVTKQHIILASKQDLELRADQLNVVIILPLAGLRLFVPFDVKMWPLFFSSSVGLFEYRAHYVKDISQADYISFPSSDLIPVFWHAV